ncbi:glycoside hydrolase family 92 protein [Xylariomycetidae sp. FL0641]|nr:glycoside hydrolase family 92 protein [Xylariomycetidae sp. FL0641]
MPRFARLAVSAASAAATSYTQDLTQYVLPDTGATDGGNTFPGVSLPLGMVKLGPDLYTGSDAYSGYQPDGNFVGFSMLHESGTGGAPKYGVVSQMPAVNQVGNPLDDRNVGRSEPDEASLGYYKSSLANGITLELGATAHAGLYQYTFPDNVTATNVIVDVSSVLPSFRGQGLGQNYLGGNISVASTDSGLRYEGAGSYDNGWNEAPKWTVFFCGYFDQNATFKTFLGDEAGSDTLVEYSDTPGQNSTARLGAVFTFDSKEVKSRVGVSFISPEQACNNVNSEISAETSLATLQENAKTAWSDQVLSKLTTTDTNTTRLRLLYTSLYHTSLMPTNKTGENPLWTSTEPYYDDIFTLWDTHRCGTSLFQILQPAAYEEFIRSLIDVWRHEGFLPDARSSFWNGATQGGSNADSVLADAYVKGVRGSVDWDDGWSAMWTDAELVPPNNDDPRDPSSSTKEGRGALPDWLERGYITTKYGRSVSRAIEYAANDFALYQVARGLGNRSAAEMYLQRSRQWRNQWNPSLSATVNHHATFTGFLGPRRDDGDGSWVADQDPLDCGGCYWGDAYYEALPIEYSFNAHHDLSTLIARMGGPGAFVARLDAMFEPASDGGGDTLFNPGNEPSFLTPYLYHFVAGQQHRSVARARSVADAHYAPTPGGLPGNSDAGAMEAWLLWNMVGLYPVVGQTTFLVGSPWFADLSIDLGGGHKRLNITAQGVDEGIYVQSLAVNGEPWDKAWVSWDDVFANGGTMDFVLGSEPVDWATGDLPPSPASETA